MPSSAVSSMPVPSSTMASSGGMFQFRGRRSPLIDTVSPATSPIRLQSTKKCTSMSWAVNWVGSWSFHHTSISS